MFVLFFVFFHCLSSMFSSLNHQFFVLSKIWFVVKFVRSFAANDRFFCFLIAMLFCFDDIFFCLSIVRAIRNFRFCRIDISKAFFFFYHFDFIRFVSSFFFSSILRTKQIRIFSKFSICFSIFASRSATFDFVIVKFCFMFSNATSLFARRRRSCSREHKWTSREIFYSRSIDCVRFANCMLFSLFFVEISSSSLTTIEFVSFRLQISLIKKSTVFCSRTLKSFVYAFWLTFHAVFDHYCVRVVDDFFDENFVNRSDSSQNNSHHTIDVNNDNNRRIFFFNFRFVSHAERHRVLFFAIFVREFRFRSSHVIFRVFFDFSRVDFCDVSQHSFIFQKRRVSSRNIYLSTWKHSKFVFFANNVVYDSRNRRNHINRRMSKKIDNEKIVFENNFDVRKIVCNHDDVNYIEKYRDLIVEKINAIIVSLLSIQKKTKMNTTINTF